MKQSHAFAPENECKSMNLQGSLSYFPHSASREESKPQRNMIWMLIPSHNLHFVCFISGIVGPFECFFAFPHFSHNCSVSPAVTAGAATRVLNLLISVKVEWKHFQSRPVACREAGGGGWAKVGPLDQAKRPQWLTYSCDNKLFFFLFFLFNFHLVNLWGAERLWQLTKFCKKVWRCNQLWESFISLIFREQADLKVFNHISHGTVSILLMA